MTRKSFKFLLLVLVVNTVLFTVASVVGFSIWWVLLAEVALWVGYIMVKAWFDPAQRLVAQGSHMGWAAAGTMRDEHGWRDTLLRRNGVVTRVSYKTKLLYIVEPVPSGPHKDFIEIEHLMGPPDAVVLRSDDPVTRVRAALLEIEANTEIPAMSLVRPGVEGLLRNAERVRYSIENDGIEPRTLAYLLIHNVAMDQLTSGEHHIYRGTLGPVGRGLKSAYMAANRKLMEVGYQDDETRKHSEAEVMREVGEVG